MGKSSGHRWLRRWLASACLLLTACTGDTLPRPERVVVLVLDSTHAAHLGSYGGPAGLTPALDALADRSMRFANAVSNTTWTLPSTVSLMTGQLQETHGIVTNHHAVEDDTVLLAEQFQAAGYRTAAFVQMIYASEVHGLDQGFEAWNRYQLTAGIRPERMVAAVEQWMRDHADERYFLYVHLRRPHSPYDPSPLFRRHLERDCPLADGSRDETLAHADSRVSGPLDELERQHVEHLYRANLAMVDDRIRDLLSLAESDQRLLLVMTSDHGEALGQNGHYGHGYHLDPECIAIPLLVSGPGIVPGVETSPVSTVDIAPTLLALCGLSAPHDVDGRSMVPRLAGDTMPERPVLLSTRYTLASEPSYGLIEAGTKIVLDRDGSLNVHDAASGEVVPSAHFTEGVERAGERLRARKTRAAGLAQRPGRSPLSDEAQAELRALGYLR